MKLVNSTTFQVIFQFILVLAFATRFVPLYILLFVLTLGLVGKNLNLFSHLGKRAKIIIYLYATIVVLMVSLKFFFQPIVLAQSVLVLFSIVPALILTKNLKIFVKASSFLIYVYQIFSIAFSYFYGLDQFPGVIPFEHLIPGVSSNGIPSYLILLQVNYSIGYYLLKNNVNLLSTILTLGVAILGFGRGSILAAFLILLTSFIFWIFKKSGFRALVYTMLFYILIAFLIFNYQFQIVQFLDANTKLSAGLVDDSRVQMIHDYLGKLDFVTFLFGADYSNTSIVNLYGGNPHNSFIRAHHLFGLFYVVFLVVLPFVTIFKRDAVIDILYFCCLFLILYFRIFSEPIIFPTIFDFYYWCPLLLILRLPNKRNIL